MVALSIHSLVWEDAEQSWRLAELNEEGEKITAFLIGYISWEDIEHIDIDGDEYYPFPHIFCRFQNAGQPYERLAFCERKELPNGVEFYTEIADMDAVKLTSEKYGTARWAWRNS